MRKSLIYLLFIAAIMVFVSCESGETKQHQDQADEIVNIEAEKLKVSDLLDRLAEATEAGNIEAIENIWCPEPHSLLLGTENDEKLVGWKQIKHAITGQSTTFKEMLIAITDQNIQIDRDGRTAWFFEELNYSFILDNKAMSFEGIRFTGVFVKSMDDEWKLVQGHMSVASSLDVD